MYQWVCLVRHLVVENLVCYDVLRYVMTPVNRACLMRLNIVVVFNLVLVPHLAIGYLSLAWRVNRLVQVVVELRSIVKLRGWVAHTDELVAHLRVTRVLILRVLKHLLGTRVLDGLRESTLLGGNAVDWTGVHASVDE
jgi:hypothetical protein